MIRFAFDEYLRPQLVSPTASQTTQQDLDFLARFFSKVRGRTYTVAFGSETRRTLRRSSAILEDPLGEQDIVVDRMELTDEDFKQARARLVRKGTLAEQGQHQMNKLELAAILRETVRTKLIESSLVRMEAPERALLLRNRVEGTSESTYLGSAVSFRAMPIEHGYLIARGRLLELW